MLRFALKTLVSDRSKMLTGLAGVVFSLVLVNVQGGLYLGLMSKASVLVDHCDADLWVGQQMVENVDLARDIPELWMNRLRGIPGVSGVRPYIVGKGTAALDDGRMEDVWVIGSMILLAMMILVCGLLATFLLITLAHRTTSTFLPLRDYRFFYESVQRVDQ